MPDIEVRPGVRLHCRDDWFGAPWLAGEPIVLVHGVAESGIAWNQWICPLADSFRVLRPDLPGFGLSPVPDDYSWTAAEIAADLARLLDAMAIGRFHLVGAKYGGSIAMELAVQQGGRVRSLSVMGGPTRGDGKGAVPARIREVGVRAWAAETQRSRLGPDAPEEQVIWWTEGLMGKADPRPCIGCSGARAMMDLDARLAAIEAPTLVVTTEDSGLQSVAAVQAYCDRIPDARMVVMPGAAYHVAVTRPKECAAEVLAFIRALPRSAS